MSKCLGRDIQCSSTLKANIELPATSRHHGDMTERLLKVTLSPNQTNKLMKLHITHMQSTVSVLDIFFTLC